MGIINDMTTADTEDVFDTRPEVQQLFRQLKDNQANLEQLLERCSDMWGYDDVVYRFYHQSFKVFRVQESTRQIVDALHALAPDRELNPWFTQIVADGTGHQFTLADNRRWLEVARPILEAYFHARFFLEMAVKSGRDLPAPPRLLPSGWAVLLYLYGLR